MKKTFRAGAACVIAAFAIFGSLAVITRLNHRASFDPKAERTAFSKVSLQTDPQSGQQYVEAEVTISKPFNSVGINGDVKEVELADLWTGNWKVNEKVFYPFDRKINQTATGLTTHLPTFVTLHVLHETETRDYYEDIRVPLMTHLGQVRVYHLICPNDPYRYGWYAMVDQNGTHDSGWEDDLGPPDIN